MWPKALRPLPCRIRSCLSFAPSLLHFPFAGILVLKEGMNTTARKQGNHSQKTAHPGVFRGTARETHEGDHRTNPNLRSSSPKKHNYKQSWKPLYSHGK